MTHQQWLSKYSRKATMINQRRHILCTHVQTKRQFDHWKLCGTLNRTSCNESISKLNCYCFCCYYYYYSSTTTTFRLFNQRTFLKLLQVKPEGLRNGNMTKTPEQIYLPALSTIIVDWFGATSSIVTMRLPRDLALLMCLGAQSIIKSTEPFAQSSDAFLH